MTKLRTALAHLVLPGKGGGLSKERGAGSEAPLSIAALGPDFGEQLAMAHLPSHSHSQAHSHRQPREQAGVKVVSTRV